MASFPTLPQSRIKRIAKFDPDVNMINAEATLALTAATVESTFYYVSHWILMWILILNNLNIMPKTFLQEAFICELSKAVYMHASASKRKTIQMKDFGTCAIL